MNVLQNHLKLREEELMQLSRIAGQSGHPVQMGSAREDYIREFLRQHHGESVTIAGPGEIIDSDSQINQMRNQYDVLVVRKDYPRIPLSTFTSAYLVESVIATVEVKSTLTKHELQKSFQSAKALKSLKPSLNLSGLYMNPPYCGPLYILVAYDMKGSLNSLCRNLHEFSLETHPVVNPDSRPEDTYRSNAIDAICILGRGIIHFRRLPLGFRPLETEYNLPHEWVQARSKSGALAFLFALVTDASTRGHVVPHINNYLAGGIEPEQLFTF